MVYCARNVILSLPCVSEDSNLPVFICYQLFLQPQTITVSWAQQPAQLGKAITNTNNSKKLNTHINLPLVLFITKNQKTGKQYHFSRVHYSNPISAISTGEILVWSVDVKVGYGLAPGLKWKRFSGLAYLKENISKFVVQTSLAMKNSSAGIVPSYCEVHQHYFTCEV